MINAIKSKITRQRAILTIVILVTITAFWSIMGSLIHINNSNKIVNNYLLQSQSITAQFLNAATAYTLKSIASPTCVQPASMDFIAHEDDDILFMNPDLLHDIQAGNCVRTVYLTAGDDGRDRSYWLSRQKGIEEAYDSMLGKTGEAWEEQVIKLPGGQLATIANPAGNSKILLIFLHLPDGNLRGTGFPRTSNQSLGKLYSGNIATLQTVDKSSSYSSDQLIQALTNLMQTFKPTNIRSLSSSAGIRYQDHSDHTNVARFTAKAYDAYIKQLAGLAKIPPITYYLGYIIRELPANLSSGDVDQKTRAFLAYGAFDSASCHKIMLCYTQAIYGSYLKRQYTNPY